MTKRIPFILFLLTVICMAMSILPGTAAAAEYIATELPTASAETRALIEPDANSVNVAEGGTYTLTVSGTSGTVTWDSVNPAIATVNASGVVTGVKAGTTSITASVDGSVYQSFTVYVRISDGMYYISRSGLRLGTTGRVDSNTRTCLTAPAATGFEQLKQLWKITYLSKGYYSIRPMYKLDMGLHATSNYADIVPISTNDTLNDVGLANCWGIEYANGGYVLKYVNSGSMALYPISTYTGASVITSTYSSTGSGFHWSLQKVSTVNNQVILIDTNTGSVLTNAFYSIEPARSLTLEKLHLCASFVSPSTNNQSIAWSSNSSSVAMVNSSTGRVTGIEYGKSATITATHIHNGSAYSSSYTLSVNTPPSSPPLVPQEQSNWCWAATGQMLALNYAPSITATQSSAVRYVKGATNDVPGFPSETLMVADYLLATVSNNTDLACTQYGTILTETALINYLDAGHAVAIHRGLYYGDDANNSRMAGHALIICGYVTINGVNQYLLLDPLPVNEGDIIYMTYAQIVCDDSSLHYMWDAVIAADISYFDDTISIK